MGKARPRGQLNPVKPCITL